MANEDGDQLQISSVPSSDDFGDDTLASLPRRGGAGGGTTTVNYGSTATAPERRETLLPSDSVVGMDRVVTKSEGEGVQIVSCQ